MSAPRLALLLCLVLPIPGLAQGTHASEVPAPSVTPPPLVPAPAEPQEPSDTPLASPEDSTEGSSEGAPGSLRVPRERNPERTYSSTAPRLVLEFFGGAVGVGVGVIPGGLLALSSFCTECDDGELTRFYLGVALGLVGIAGGTAAGIVGAASLVHGEGAYWPTAAGAGIGTLAGALAGILTARAIAGAEDQAALIPAISGPIIGGMIGYELSHSNAEERRLQSSASGAQILPVISLHPSGGIIGGLVGRF
jgi:hypothetical protein